MRAYFWFVALALLVFESQTHSSRPGRYKVLIWESGPAKIGELVIFHAKVVLNREAIAGHDKSGDNVTYNYRFAWKFTGTRFMLLPHSRESLCIFDTVFKEAGIKDVDVYVEIFDANGPDPSGEHRGQFLGSANNCTKVTITAAG